MKVEKREKTYEENVIDKLIGIENRLTKIETSMTWFKYIARGGVIIVFGFFGVDAVGLV